MNKNKRKKLSSLQQGLIILLLVFILFICYLILIDNNQFIQEKFYRKSDLGDAIGGISSPYIGLMGIVLTFGAFWTQYQFNKRQLLIYNNDKISQKIDEFFKLLESVINQNIINDVDVKKDIKSTLKKHIDELIEIKKNDQYFFLTYKNIEELFLTGLKAKIHRIYTSPNKMNTHEKSTKIEDYKKISTLIEQYFNLLKIFKIELDLLYVDKSEIIQYFVLFDNKFDILCGKQIEQFKSLILYYINVKDEYDIDIAYLLNIKYGSDLKVFDSFFSYYITDRNSE